MAVAVTMPLSDEVRCIQQDNKKDKEDPPSQYKVSM